jgi:4-hydroxybenzoate polyprenyltransferase
LFKHWKAILSLIRFPNLLFIFITQLLSYECIVLRGLGKSICIADDQSIPIPFFQFLLLSLSTILIAAAGYMINDYFDMGIDTINKPEKVTIEKIFSRRRIITWHIVLNFIALVMASIIFITYLKWRFLVIQLFSIFLLVIYSTTLKRKLLIGNLSIACLTGLTVFSVGVYHPHFDVLNLQARPVQVFWLYILFAFFITLIREIVKDIEDMKGDSSQQCKTIPLVWGISKAKQIIYAISILLILLIVIALYFKANPSLYLGLIWVLGIVVPLVVVLVYVQKANNAIQFRKLSSYLKVMTLIGILSMLFI